MLLFLSFSQLPEIGNWQLPRQRELEGALHPHNARINKNLRFQRQHFNPAVQPTPQFSITKLLPGRQEFL